MKLDLGSLLLQAANFGVLVWLLHRFLYRPLGELVARRRQQMTEQALLFEQQRAVIEHDRADIDAEKKRLAAGLEASAAAAKTAAEVACRALQVQSEERIRIAEQASRRALEQERTDARRSMAEEAALLAGDFAAKLAGRAGVGVPLQVFLAGACDALEAARDRIPHAGHDLVVVTSRILDAQEHTMCGARLDALRIPGLRTTFEVDPALLAGVEFRLAGLVIRNHWAADLAALRHAVGGANA